MRNTLTLLCALGLACAGAPGKRAFSPLGDGDLTEVDGLQTLPVASALFLRHVDATGGEAAYRAITSRYTKAQIRERDSSASVMLEIWEQAPNQIKMQVSMDGRVVNTSGASNGIAWRQDAILGLEVPKGEALREALLSATFHPEIHWTIRYASVKTEASEPIRGTQAFRVRALSPTGRVHILWFDARSRLMVKDEYLAHDATESDRSLMYYSDYRVVGGVATPFQIRMQSSGAETNVQVLESLTNLTIPAEVFAIPKEARRPRTR